MNSVFPGLNLCRLKVYIGNDLSREFINEIKHRNRCHESEAHDDLVTRSRMLDVSERGITTAMAPCKANVDSKFAYSIDLSKEKPISGIEFRFQGREKLSAYHSTQCNGACNFAEGERQKLLIAQSLRFIEEIYQGEAIRIDLVTSSHTPALVCLCACVGGCR
jgi:hypothetical protein